MEEHSLRVLEFGKIVAKLQDQAASAIGREVAGLTYPAAELDAARRRQQETSEARAILQFEGNIPFGGIEDIRGYVERAAIEALLQPHELLSVMSTLRSATRLRDFLAALKERYPLAGSLASEIESFPAIEQEIAGAISQSAEVLDSASGALARVRSELRTVHARLSERMQSYLQSYEYRNIIQEPIITMRDDRYCIPIKAEHRGQFSGIVHDMSASGATVFVEPAAVVEMGNRRKELAIKEREEVEKVLAKLTARVGRDGDRITASMNAVGVLDCIAARAKLSLAMDATEPVLNDEGRIDLRAARHPLLTGEVMPIDFALGGAFKALLITGPNTGGKTVSLKTAGLLSLMAASGLHVPASIGSELAVFGQVFADIGDEQSIEQSLSTFSSHMGNIVRITRAANARSLVLLDEIGAGTDPAEGAALAKSILDHLLARGARVVATTHYGELKEFAYLREGVENACVEFDPVSLRPTYRLMIGIPGSSNAFAIAARLGLAEPIVTQARSSLASHAEATDELIRRIEESHRAAAEERRAAAQSSSDAERLKHRYEEQLRGLEQARGRVESKARERAEALTQAYSRKLDRTLEQLAAQKKDSKRAQDLKRTAEKLLDQFEQANAAAEPEEPPEEALEAGTGLAAGTPVRIAGVSQDGRIVEPPDDGRVVVMIGVMRVTVPISSLRKPRGEPEAGPKPRSPEAAIALEKARDFSPEISLRGLRAEPAIVKLDKYLDDALAAGIDQVRIIHGKGTGAMRNAVWEYLRGHRGISSFRLGEQEEGGSGATVVTMRR